MEQTNKILVGSLAVVFATLLWSLDGTFLRPQLYTLPSVLVVFLEHGLGFVVLVPWLLIFKNQLKLITKKQWLAIFWVALFGGALGTTFMTKALFMTGFKDISVVILLQKFQPTLLCGNFRRRTKNDKWSGPALGELAFLAGTLSARL
ncbi:MAG: EamA family transporter [Candidatus Kerfeldbacteria bacterium]|nr:EamA family transporter [Candidatus Kerfeldbacteria bacterium]